MIDEALRTILPVAGWGENLYGELNFPLTWTNVVSIAAAQSDQPYINLGIKADGTHCLSLSSPR